MATEGERRKSYSRVPIDDINRPSNQMPAVTWVGDYAPFESEHSKLLYDELTCRPIATGKSLNLGGQYNEYLLHYLQWARLDNLFILESEIYVILVRLFYANIRRAIVNGTEEWVSVLKRRLMVISEETISRALLIPNSGERVFFTKKAELLKYLEENEISVADYYGTFCVHPNQQRQLKTDSIKPEFRLLKHYLAVNILPRTGHGDEVEPFLGFMIYRFVTQKELNIPYIIMNVMLRATECGKVIKAIPYGAFLTRFFKSWEIPLFPQTDSVIPIDRALDVNAARAIKEFPPNRGGNDGEAETSTRRRHSVSGPSSVPSTDTDVMSLINERFDRLENRFERVEEAVADLTKTQSGMQKESKSLVRLFKGFFKSKKGHGGSQQSQVPESPSWSSHCSSTSGSIQF